MKSEIQSPATPGVSCLSNHSFSGVLGGFREPISLFEPAGTRLVFRDDGYWPLR
jgi:hypothetical protein